MNDESTAAVNLPVPHRRRHDGVLSRRILPILLLALGAGTVLYYIIFPAQGYMTGDSMDSLRWAQASVDSGRLVSPDFSYAAVLPFGGNLIMAPFVAIFGYSAAAQIAGMCVFAVALIAAMFYLARGIGLSRFASSGFVTACVLILSLSPKLREIMWEHIFYYNLGILFFCIGFGLAVRILRSDSALLLDLSAQSSGKPLAPLFWTGMLVAVILAVYGLKSLVAFTVCMLIELAVAVVLGILIRRKFRRTGVRHTAWLWALILVVFSTLAATNGLLSLVCFALPLLVGIVAERLCDRDTPLFSPQNVRTFALVAAVAAATGIGVIMTARATGGVTAGYADAYSAYAAPSAWSKNLLNFLPNWFSLLGVSVRDGDPLASVDSVHNMLRIFCGLFLLVFPFVMLGMLRHIRTAGVKMVLFGHFAVSAFIVYAVVFGKLGNADWRLTPMLGTALITTCLGLWEFVTQRDTPRARFSGLFMLPLIAAVLMSALQIAKMPADYGRNNSWHRTAQVLQEKGLYHGYANFWWAQPIAVFSDDEVKIASFIDSNGKPVKYDYQLPTDAFDDRDTDSWFVLFTESEYPTYQEWVAVQKNRGKVKEIFTIESEPYKLRGHTGSAVYVVVLTENIF